MTLNALTLHSDKPDALYFAVDLADADLDEFGQAMLAEQELRRRHKVALIYADASRATTECYLKKNPPDPIACPEKPRTEKSQSRSTSSTAALNAPVLESGATITPKPAPPATEYGAWFCDKCNKKAAGIGPWKMPNHGGYKIGERSNWCCDCGNSVPMTFRACDESGREIAEGKAFTYFSVAGFDGLKRAAGEVVEYWNPVTKSWRESSWSIKELRKYSITESAALAILGEGR